jgi:hypothetical protein
MRALSGARPGEVSATRICSSSRTNASPTSSRSASTRAICGAASSSSEVPDCAPFTRSGSGRPIPAASKIAFRRTSSRVAACSMYEPLDSRSFASARSGRHHGAWRFKETTWIKVPGTNRRVPRKRDASEVIAQERPELRIVPPELWSAVRKRRAGVRDLHARTGRNSIATRAVYPLSGLLHCAACGAPMTIFGGTRTAKRYRCAHQVQRGTCDNALSVREDVARRSIVDCVKARLLRPEGLAFVRQELARRMGELNRGLDAELKERRARLARTEDKIRGLVEFIATGDRSDYVVSTMRDLEAHAKREKAAIAELVRQAASRSPCPRSTRSRPPWAISTRSSPRTRSAAAPRSTGCSRAAGSISIRSPMASTWPARSCSRSPPSLKTASATRRVADILKG